MLELRQEQEPDLSTPSLQELEEWKQIGLLPPGKGGRAVTVRDCGEMKLHHVGKDTFDFEQKLLREINEWEPGHDWIPRPLALGRSTSSSCTAAIGALQILRSGYHGTVRSSRSRSILPSISNILKDDIWKRLIWARKVTGGHAGPPCETFSFARWLLLEDGQGPQPLRTTEAPWGRDNLSLKEVQQVVTGTKLMLQGIYLLLLIYLQGGSFSLEHPKGRDGQEGRWSIWESAFLKLLLLAGDVWRVDFLQGRLGQPFAKPTSIIAGRLPDLPQHYLRYAGDLSASQTECNQNINVKIYIYMIYVIIKGDNITNLKNKLTRKCDALMTTRSYPMPRRDAATDDGTSFVCGAIFELDLFVGAFKLEEIEVPENALRPVRNHGQTYG